MACRYTLQIFSGLVCILGCL